MPHLTLAPSLGHRSTPLGTITVPPCASPELTLCNACSVTHCFQGTILPSGYPGQTRKQSLAAHPLLCRHVRARLDLKVSAAQPPPVAPACSVRSQVLSGLEMTDNCGLRTSGERGHSSVIIFLFLLGFITEYPFDYPLKPTLSSEAE